MKPYAKAESHVIQTREPDKAKKLTYGFMDET